MSDQNTKQNIISLKWDRKEQSDQETAEEFSPMREWQTEAFDLLKDAPNMILNAPMGSGKSWMMCLLSAYKLKRDGSLRCIIGVPQTIIAPGFVEAKLTMPSGEKINWKVRHNLCTEGASSRSTVKALIDWLKTPHVDLNDRILLCTHSTLLRVYLKLQELGELALLNNLLLWIDEAHHVMNTAFEEMPDRIENNGIGKLVEHLLSQSIKNTQVGLTTASFFRGDRRALLTEEMEARFARYNLPYDKYLKSMKYLESFGFDFLICGYDYIKGIELLTRQRKGKDIIYIPHPNSQHSTRDKLNEVDLIISKYELIHGNDRQKTDDGLTILKDLGGKSFKVIDLVDDHAIRRSQRKSFIHNPVLKQDPGALDAIIALNMFKEGANWIWADRCIIVGARSSLVDIIQMIGRVFRDAKGKKHVEVIQLLPFSLDQKNEGEFRSNLNDYLKAIYASLILENILDPVKIKIPTQREETKKSKEDNGSGKTDLTEDWLKQAVPDESKQQTLIECVGEQLMNIKSEKKEPLTWTEHQEIVKEILADNGINEHRDEIAQQLLGIFVRKTLRLNGISVDSIDFDILKVAEPLEFLLRYTSGACNIDTFSGLRNAIQASRQWRPFKEARSWVRQFKLGSETQWRSYIAGEMPHLPPLPEDIPRAPWVAYENKGWISLGDFLGTNVTAPRLRKYRSYEEARTFARELGLKRKEDWPLYTQGKLPHLPSLPNDIPATPDKTYRRSEYGKKWTSWGDFLGTGRISNQERSKQYKSYPEAKAFVRPLHLKSSGEWKKYIAGKISYLPPLPNDIPKKPDLTYENFTWTDFLGYKVHKLSSKREFWPFKKARAFVRKLGLKTLKQWQAYCAAEFPNLPSKPMEIPSNPSKKYKNSGWQGYADWMGHKR